MKTEHLWAVLTVIVALAVWELFLRSIVSGWITKK